MSALSGEAVGTVVFLRGPELTLERVKATVAKLPGIQTEFEVLVDGQILDDDNEKLCGLLKQISVGEIKVFSIVRLGSRRGVMDGPQRGACEKVAA